LAAFLELLDVVILEAKESLSALRTSRIPEERRGRHVSSVE